MASADNASAPSPRTRCAALTLSGLRPTTTTRAPWQPNARQASRHRPVGPAMTTNDLPLSSKPSMFESGPGAPRLERIILDGAHLGVSDVRQIEFWQARMNDEGRRTKPERM